MPLQIAHALLEVERLRLELEQRIVVGVGQPARLVGQGSQGISRDGPPLELAQVVLERLNAAQVDVELWGVSVGP